MTSEMERAVRIMLGVCLGILCAWAIDDWRGPTLDCQPMNDLPGAPK